MRLTLAPALLTLAACSGGALPLARPGVDRVEVAGDVFFIRRNGLHAEIRNYETALHNQDRLFANAQIAIATLSGCQVKTFAQTPGVNTYSATLDCAA